MKKVEDDMGFEGTSLPDKHNCTLADLYSGHYNVRSIKARNRGERNNHMLTKNSDRQTENSWGRV